MRIIRNAVCPQIANEISVRQIRSENLTHDRDTEDDSPHWVDPIMQFASKHTSHNTECVYEEIVPVVCPQYPNLRVDVLQPPAIEK